MPLLVTLYDELGPDAQEEGTWTDVSVTSPSPSAPVAWNATIDFDGFADGTYAYEYTVENTNSTHTDTKTVTIELVTPPARTNDVCDSANPLTWLPTVGASALSVNTGDDCPTQSAPKDSGIAVPPSWSSAFTATGTSGPPKDLWYRCSVSPDGATDPVIDVRVQSTGDISPMVALYTGTCGTLSILDHSAAPNGNLTATTPVVVSTSGSFTNIWVRVASIDPGVIDVFISPNLNL